MVKWGLGLDDEGGSQGEPQSKSPQESRRLSIQRCIQSLVHACQCRNANCSLPSCQKMKRVVQHTKGCKRKTNGGCPICKQLIALCCYHAKHCQENKCPVPFCLNIKQKTAYEIDHCDWSSDVCSSDMLALRHWQACTSDWMQRWMLRRRESPGLCVAAACWLLLSSSSPSPSFSILWSWFLVL